MASYSTIVRTEDLYLCLYDKHSPVAVPGLWNKFLAEAKQKAGGDPTALYYFNQAWAELIQKKDLLAWVLLFDGVYQIQIEVLEEEEDLVAVGEQVPYVGFSENLAEASFATGQLVVGNLIHFGDETPASMTVPPGIYDAFLFGDDDEQQKHMFLTDVSEYPEDDGPDWTLYLKRKALYG